MITVDTGLIPLLGKPLRQSFAPRLQNATYKALGLDFRYFPLEVENDHLGEIVQAWRTVNSPGFAVTKPNKIKVIDYLDGLDELAEKMGAVNTVVKRGDKLIGYNTDGEGFVRSFIAETDAKLEEKTFLCYGAGGAGRAICCSLAYHGAKKIVIVDLSNANAQDLADEVNRVFAPVASWISFAEKAKIAEAIRSADVVMNNSGVGMYPKTDQTPIDKALLNKGQICFDATYNPLKTLFLREAEEVGCRIINGQGMSVYQAAIQINLWSGKPEPIDLLWGENNRIVQEMQLQAAQK